MTKVGLERPAIDAIARQALGARVVSVREAQGGMYNAGYHLELEGASRSAAFLKVAPPDGLAVLTYEQGLMKAEADVLTRVAAAGVGCAPLLLASDFSRHTIDRDYLLMTHLDGRSLSELALPHDARVVIRHEIGRIAGEIRNATGSMFGYPGQPALRAARWPDAFALMWNAVHADATRFATPWPMPGDEIDDAFARACTVLDDIETPRLVHFDLWDGNVLIDGTRISGVIDWERAFFGDPLAELVSLHFFDDPDELRALLEGLAKGTGAAVELDLRVQRRLALYRAYLWMIMIVEAAPRGFAGSIRTTGSTAARRYRRDLLLAASG